MENELKGIVLAVIVVVFFWITAYIVAWYSYDKNVGTYWELATRSSTLKQKAEYLQKYYDTLKESKHSEYSAIIFKTPTNNFDENLKVLHSLVERVHNTEKMNSNSLEYQMAIQQITKQEQDEASDMTQVLAECYLMGKSILLNISLFLSGVIISVLLIGVLLVIITDL